MGGATWRAEAASREKVRPYTAGPEARLIDGDEIHGIHRMLGIEPDQTRLDRLANHILKKLPTTARGALLTDLLPSDTHEYSYEVKGRTQTRKALTVAGSEIVIVERHAAKLAVCDFFGLDPEKLLGDPVWYEDLHVTRPTVARGGTQLQKAAVSDLSALLNSEYSPFEGQLPEDVLLTPATRR